MKTKLGKNVISLLMAVVLCLSLVPAAKTQAAAPEFEKKVTLRVYKGEMADKCSRKLMDVRVPYWNTKIKRVRSSNKKIVTVESAADVYGVNEFYITPKKAGKTKVTFQYKKKTYTISVQVKYWENPCKTFQIGKTNYSQYFNTSNQYSLSQQNKKITGKINIVPKKGWKLESINVCGKKVKNKSKVTIRGGKRAPGMLSVVARYSYAYATFTNKKTGEEALVLLEFTPNKGNGYNDHYDYLN